MNSSKNKVKFLARAYFYLLPWSRPKRLWALAALLLLLFLSFQYLISHWQAVLGPLASGEELQLLDAHFGIREKEIIPLLEHLGPSYRQEQSYLYMSLDLIYPLAYGLFFSAWLLFLLQNSFPRYLGSLYQLCFFPFLISITDLLEKYLLYCCFGAILGFPLGFGPWPPFLIRQNGLESTCCSSSSS